MFLYVILGESKFKLALIEEPLSKLYLPETPTPFEPYKNNQDYQIESIYYMLSFAHNRTNNYNLSINYAKKLENNKEYQLNAYDLLYSNYVSLKNMQQARVYAIKLASLQPCASNYYKVVFTTQSSTEKLKYYYLIADAYIKIGNKENDTTALSIMYNDIIPLENEKIKNAVKNVKGFIELPDYKSIFDSDYKYMTPEKAYTRCKEFYTSINNGITKYSGNDLKGYFSSVISKEKIKTDRLIEEYRALEQRIAEVQRLKELQRMNANLQYANYLRNQQNQNLRNINNSINRPRTYYNIGNTIYSY